MKQVNSDNPQDKHVSKKHQKYLKTNDEKMPKSVVAIAVIIVLLIFGTIFGIVPYTIKYVECGKPPTVIEPPGFWSGSGTGVPFEPGEEGYEPGIGKMYTCFDKDKLYPDNTPMR